MTRDKQHMYLHGWTMSGMGGLLREPPHSFGGAKLVTGEYSARVPAPAQTLRRPARSISSCAAEKAVNLRGL